MLKLKKRCSEPNYRFSILLLFLSKEDYDTPVTTPSLVASSAPSTAKFLFRKLICGLSYMFHITGLFYVCDLIYATLRIKSLNIGVIMNKRFLLFIILLLSGFAMAIEEPGFVLELKSGNYELRNYEAMIVAETKVDGDMDKASSKGFRNLAGYIFGDNKDDQGSKEKISMTAPVILEANEQKLTKDNSYWVRFVMPKEYDMNSLPTPNNAEVTLRKLPATKFAVIRFSGLAGEDKVDANLEKLQSWMAQEELQGNGEPILARYNPPWTLPFMRRNEILIPLN